MTTFPAWARDALIAVIAALLAVFVAPLLPGPIGVPILALVLWVVCAIFVVLALLDLRHA